MADQSKYSIICVRLKLKKSVFSELYFLQTEFYGVCGDFLLCDSACFSMKYMVKPIINDVKSKKSDIAAQKTAGLLSEANDI